MLPEASQPGLSGCPILATTWGAGSGSRQCLLIAIAVLKRRLKHQKDGSNKTGYHEENQKKSNWDDTHFQLRLSQSGRGAVGICGRPGAIAMLPPNDPLETNLLRAIPVHDFDAVSSPPQVFPNFFRDHY